MAGPLIQLTRRNDTAANWTSSNPILLEGEIGIEWDTNFHKIGDGTTAWNDLGYYHGPPWWGGLDGGSPASTYSGAPSGATNYGVMGSVDLGILPPISLDLSEGWFSMEAIGRADPADGGTIAIVGSKTGATFDLGILNTSTNTMTVISDAFAGTGMTVCSGIDYDASSGIYVVLRRNSVANTYHTYWADTGDLDSNWTQTTNPGTTSHGAQGLWFDSNHGIWYWSTGARLYVSADGKTFYNQLLYYDPYGTFNAPVTKCFLHSDLFQPNLAILGGSSEKVVCSNPVGLTMPIPAGAPYGEFWEGYALNPTGLIDVGNPNWTNIMLFDDEVYLSSNTGQIIKSATGALGIGNWSVVAADQAGSSSNEIIDDGGTWYFMTVINGVFWACDGSGGAGNWYRYGTGGAPTGYGWVQDDTGPFGVTVIWGAGESMRILRTPEMQFAYLGREVQATSDYHCWFNTS